MEIPLAGGEKDGQKHSSMQQGRWQTTKRLRWQVERLW